MFTLFGGSLDELLMHRLAKYPMQTAKELHSWVVREHKNYSLGAVYRELNKLQGYGILVKAKSSYSLSLSWILKARDFYSSVHENYFSPDYVQSLLPEAGKSQRWKFTDLQLANDFWNQLLVAMIHRSSNQQLFEWNPCEWYELFEKERESPLQGALTESGVHANLIIGINSPLSQKLLVEDDCYTYSFAEGPFSDRTRTHIGLLDNYILTVELDEYLEKQFELLFHTKDWIDAPRELAKIMSQKSQVKISVRNDSSKAKSLRGKFIEFWGHGTSRERTACL